MPGRRSKRAFDMISACGILLFCAPLLGIIAGLIKLTSRGPILYRQPRIGHGGRAFLMYKFRSMQTGADSAPHRRHAERLIRNRSTGGAPGDVDSWAQLTDDGRITRVGGMLRRFNLDELPQLFNVLRGDMSLVGPRPAIPYEVEMYEPWHRQRFAVPAGITGLWQVRGRGRVSFTEMVRMDLEYIDRQSLWLDIKILWQTPWAALAGRGRG